MQVHLLMVHTRKQHFTQQLAINNTTMFIYTDSLLVSLVECMGGGDDPWGYLGYDPINAKEREDSDTIYCQCNGYSIQSQSDKHINVCIGTHRAPSRFFQKG